ncbi:Bet1-like SNARE 1-1 [Sesamum alatum]|uniref:Bet1-like SNARE 1-1 n=1 Tax=Sesamum alatum TaxID=300844 RepID=A0AAE2CB91_9LAMI|nr:Bet1-like SNARE 1-1 [Sesamum alatum]
MDPDSLAASTTNAPRKVRFAPKAPPKREQKPVVPKAEKVENDLEEAKAEQLLRRLNEASLKGKPKVERKVGPTQVAFGYGGSSNSLRSYGANKNINRIPGGADQRVEKEYKEPWDYYTYYPVTLPLRRPYSGNPELLDEEEFAEDPQSSTYDECATNSALELGLLDENTEDTIFFLQLPTILPTIKESTNAEVPETNKNSNPGKSAEASQKPCRLEDIPAGLMGKMLVYRSGAIKLKLGDTLYDLQLDLDFLSAVSRQSVSAAMNSRRDRNARAALFDGIEEGGIRASSSYSTHEIDEQENDIAIDGLQDRVNLLKRISGDVHEEVQSHNHMLDRMGNDMDASRGVLSGTMDKFKMVLETKSNRRMFTLVASFVLVFLVIYYLTK